MCLSSLDGMTLKSDIYIYILNEEEIALELLLFTTLLTLNAWDLFQRYFNPLTAAGCPIILFHFEAIYLELVLDPRS